MAEQDGQEKTEAPTERKREKAREDGQVASSKELPSAALLAAATLSFMVMGQNILTAAQSMFADIMREPIRSDMNANVLYDLMATSVSKILIPFIPFAILLVVVAIFSSILQVGVRFTLKPIAPKFSKLSPFQGLKRIFGTQGLMELLKSLAKLLLIGFIGFITFEEEMGRINALALITPAQIVFYNFSVIIEVTGRMVLALIAIAIFDFMYQRWHFEQQLKMTKQEVKDEAKQSEGDPQLKARIRQIQREMSNARMMQEVPKADAIVVNPTHYAVALKYDRESMNAPQVVAKGVDYMALRIRKVADQNDVPILERPQLARDLYAGVEIGQVIPERFFKAVAEILAYVYRLQRKKR
ncbi:MAG: flagellar biosynthesis protein FlhB [bacterium]